MVPELQHSADKFSLCANRICTRCQKHTLLKYLYLHLIFFKSILAISDFFELCVLVSQEDVTAME